MGGSQRTNAQKKASAERAARRRAENVAEEQAALVLAPQSPLPGHTGHTPPPASASGSVAQAPRAAGEMTDADRETAQRVLDQDAVEDAAMSGDSGTESDGYTERSGSDSVDGSGSDNGSVARELVRGPAVNDAPYDHQWSSDGEGDQVPAKSVVTLQPRQASLRRRLLRLRMAFDQQAAEIRHGQDLLADVQNELRNGAAGDAGLDADRVDVLEDLFRTMRRELDAQLVQRGPMASAAPAAAAAPRNKGKRRAVDLASSVAPVPKRPRSSVAPSSRPALRPSSPQPSARSSSRQGTRTGGSPSVSTAFLNIPSAFSGSRPATVRGVRPESPMNMSVDGDDEVPALEPARDWRLDRDIATAIQNERAGVIAAAVESERVRAETERERVRAQAYLPITGSRTQPNVMAPDHGGSAVAPYIHSNLGSGSMQSPQRNSHLGQPPRPPQFQGPRTQPGLGPAPIMPSAQASSLQQLQLPQPPGQFPSAFAPMTFVPPQPAPAASFAPSQPMQQGFQSGPSSFNQASAPAQQAQQQAFAPPAPSPQPQQFPGQAQQFFAPQPSLPPQQTNGQAPQQQPPQGPLFSPQQWQHGYRG